MIERSKVAAKNLMKTIQPILLQRKKCEHKETLKLKEKVELVVWIPLSSTQRKVYEKYLLKRTVKDALDRKNFAVDVINDLKTISRHPFLMEASESLKGSNIIKKAEQSRDQGRDQGRVSQEDRFDLSNMSDALQSLSVSKQVKSSNNSNNNNSSSSSSSHVIRKRVSEYDDDDDKDNSDEDGDEGGRGYNIGRSNDSRFTGSASNSNSSTMHRNQHQHNTSSRPSNNNNNSYNNHNNNNDKFIDQNQAMYDDDDDEGVLDRTIGGRKVKANANVFEIVGREPETEELLQVD